MVETMTEGPTVLRIMLGTQLRRLRESRGITAQQAAGWIVLDDQPVIWRGHSAVDTAPIVTFADALIGIVRGTYPQPPDGLHWYFGHPGDVLTL